MQVSILGSRFFFFFASTLCSYLFDRLDVLRVNCRSRWMQFIQLSHEGLEVDGDSWLYSVLVRTNDVQWRKYIISHGLPQFWKLLFKKNNIIVGDRVDAVV